MSYTKEFIKDKLATDVRWMERALLALLARQTTDEQKSERTIDSNSRGFNGVDGHYLTYVAKYIQGGKHLSGKHIEKVAKRLPKYWGQILEEIEQKGN